MKDEMVKADKREGLAAEVTSNCEIAVRHLLVACAGLYGRIIRTKTIG